MDYKVTDTELTSVANAIRTKGGTSRQLTFPSDFVTAIGNIPSGSGGSTNILYGMTTIPASNLGNNGDIYLAYGDIPNEYTALEYLEVQEAGPYIDTGVPCTPYKYFEVECNWTSSPSNNSGIFGSQTNFEFAVNAWQGNAFIAAGSNHLNITNPLVRHKLRADNNGLYIDDDWLSTSVNWTNATNRNYYIFANNYTSSVLKASYARVYTVKIYHDVDMVRHFIPAERKIDGELGFYDIVNRTFYPNIGTGSFISGPEASYTSNQKNIFMTYCKVNDIWQNLIGTDIDDVNTGN